jgi:hypothetical protein
MGRPTPDTLSPRWDGRPARLEVFYVTVSDPATGLGCWIHHELVAPTAGAPYAHGWAAVFRPGAPPVLERFGPDFAGVVGRVGAPEDGGAVPTGAAGAVPTRAAGAVLDPPRVTGSAGRLGWDLMWADGGPGPGAPPLFTFPAWAWRRQVLPAAQVVPIAAAAFTGTIAVGDERTALSPAAHGGVAHIYGHGNAERWGWLHADLGDGDVLEIVSAVGRRPGLRALPPLALVQLRLGGRDWPRDPLVAAPLFRTELGLPTWRVAGTVGRWRLRADVTVPPDDSVRVGYVDPDGATATCTNSGRADADIVLERRRRSWEVVARWNLRAGAHAEVGTRP